MAAAAAISFEEPRQSFATPRARQQLQAYLDGWLDRLETHMPDDTPSLEALTQAVCAMRQELTGRISHALGAQPQARGLHQRTRPCPQGQGLRPARPTPPRTVPTMEGEVSLSRPSCSGRHCQQGFSLLAEVRQLSERRTPWDLQTAGARLAAEGPLKTAQERFRDRTGLSWSEHTRQEVTGELSHAWGGLEGRPTAAEMAHRVAAMAAGQGVGERWRRWPHASGARQRSGHWLPAHPGSPGRVAGGMAGGQGGSLRLGGSGAHRACVEWAPRAHRRRGRRRAAAGQRRRLDPRGPGALGWARRGGTVDRDAGSCHLSYRCADPGRRPRPGSTCIRWQACRSALTRRTSTQGWKP